MANIQCPHCDREIAIESGDYGTFDCPYCQSEFNYSAVGKYAKPTAMTVFFVVLALISASLTALVLFPDSSSNSDSSASSQKDDPCKDSENPDCKSPGGNNGGATWGDTVEDVVTGIGIGIGEGLGAAFGTFVTIVCASCGGLLTLLFSLKASRRYSEDVELHKSQLL